MTTLKVGIASYEEMKARTMAVAQGERRIKAEEPKVWFTSTESFAKVLSAGNRELLRVIAEKAPGSLDELARITGKAKSNLSRTLRTMEGYGLVRLERGERGRITPKVIHDRVDYSCSWAAKIVCRTDIDGAVAELKKINVPQSAAVTLRSQRSFGRHPSPCGLRGSPPPEARRAERPET